MVLTNQQRVSQHAKGPLHSCLCVNVAVVQICTSSTVEPEQTGYAMEPANKRETRGRKPRPKVDAVFVFQGSDEGRKGRSKKVHSSTRRRMQLNTLEEELKVRAWPGRPPNYPARSVCGLVLLLSL